MKVAPTGVTTARAREPAVEAVEAARAGAGSAALLLTPASEHVAIRLAETATWGR